MQDLQQSVGLTDGEKLRVYLDERGTRYAWLAGKLGYSRSWIVHVMNGKLNISQSHKDKIEEILNAKIF